MIWLCSFTPTFTTVALVLSWSHHLSPGPCFVHFLGICNLLHWHSLLKDCVRLYVLEVLLTCHHLGPNILSHSAHSFPCNFEIIWWYLLLKLSAPRQQDCTYSAWCNIWNTVGPQEIFVGQKWLSSLSPYTSILCIDPLTCFIPCLDSGADCPLVMLLLVSWWISTSILTPRGPLSCPGIQPWALSSLSAVLRHFFNEDLIPKWLWN